jgi:hypothetical protein
VAAYRSAFEASDPTDLIAGLRIALLTTTLDAATFKGERSPKALTTVKAGTIRSVMMVVTTPRAVILGDGPNSMGKRRLLPMYR